MNALEVIQEGHLHARDLDALVGFGFNNITDALKQVRGFRDFGHESPAHPTNLETE